MKLVAVVLGAAMATVIGSVVGLPVVVVLALGGLASPPAAVPGIPPAALAAYRAAAQMCPGLGWTILAGIGEVESDHGRSTAPGVQSGANPAGAEGPMQFLPTTFRAYAAPRADGRPPSPYDLGDAAIAAARLLCANGGADPARLRQAIWNYNHSWDYVDRVLQWAARYSA